MTRREGGYIGTQPNWDAANRPGSWNVVDVYNRQRRGQWLQSNDPFINQVVCDLRFNGANNEIVFSDSGPLLLPVTRIGATGVFTSTAQSKYGGASALFPNTNGYLSINHPNLALGTGNFTIEMWLFSTTDRSNNGILSFGTNNNNFSAILHSVSNTLRIPGANTSQTISLNRWFHIAYVREGTGANQTKLYFDGVLVDTRGNATNYTQTFYNLGVYFSQSFCWGQYIDNFRVTKAARYLANFNPETDTYMG